MPYFISLSSSPTEFTKTGLLFRAIESILEQRGVEFRIARAEDFGREHLPSTHAQIQRAAAVILSTSVVTEISLRLLAAMLEALGDDALAGKPVVLVVAGGFRGQALTVEHQLKPVLLRLGTATIAARVHLGIENWRFAANGSLHQSDEVERELAEAVDLVLRGIVLRQEKQLAFATAQHLGPKNAAAF